MQQLLTQCFYLYIHTEHLLTFVQLIHENVKHYEFSSNTLVTAAGWRYLASDYDTHVNN